MEELVLRSCDSYGLAVLLAAIPGCGSGTGPSGQDYHPDLPPSWAASVTNPYLTLIPGTVFEYRSQTPSGVETSRVEVSHETRAIQGVQATIVHDQVFLDGELTEDTFDWFAQGADGTVWYLGEDSKEIDRGQVVSTEGSWEWGVRGALPGVVMWADPSAHVDTEYRQEYSKGVAEDLAIVVGLDESVQVPWGDRSGCLKTSERNALESGSVEFKYYCPGAGLVLETDQGGGQRNELTAMNGP
jgi:hypothetical protein